MKNLISETCWPHGMYEVQWSADPYPDAVLRASVVTLYTKPGERKGIVTIYEGDTPLAEAYIRDVADGQNAAFWLASIVAAAVGCSLDNFITCME